MSLVSSLLLSVTLLHWPYCLRYLNLYNFVSSKWFMTIKHTLTYVEFEA